MTSSHPPIRYGIYANLGSVDFSMTVAHVASELSAEGFSLLSDIDVKSTVKTVLGVDVPRHRILGACDLTVAVSAKTPDPIGLLLPWNVVVRENRAGEVSIGIIDPLATSRLAIDAEVAALRKQTHTRLLRVRDGLAAASASAILGRQ